MKELETRITQKGQVTVPAEVRRALGLKARDRVVFELEGGVAKIRPAVSKLLAGYGAVKPIRKPEDFGALRDEFEKGVAEDVSKETPKES